MESAATADTSPHRSDFAERVLREATRRGFPEASRCVMLGDGSLWIWNTARERFPQATQILDRYHAKEALHPNCSIDLRRYQRKSAMGNRALHRTG
jgi:transposase